ncbi:ribonuclease H-like domain-containing protein [Tanacetum coccineum]
MSQPANDDFSQHLSDDEASYHEDASENGTATNKPKQQQQLIPTTTTISNIKLPILKKEEYDIWAMEMEHYLEYIDNDVWKVIQNGNSKKIILTGKDGVVRILPPVSTVEIHVVEKERKARTILLIAIPKEHLRRFHGMDVAREIWEVIRTRFGGNANSRKMQKAILKQQFEAFTISSSEGSLPPAWSNLAMTMRTKPDVDTLSIDDLYNNLRIFEQEIISTSKSSANAQNVAFVSHSESNTNKVKFGHIGAYNNCTPTSSNNIQEREVPAGFADEVIYSLFAKQYEDLDLLHKDLEQIDDVDIEEMDINWQIAMIAIRMKKFYKKTGRRVRIDRNKPVGFDKKKLECFKCHNTGHFARECPSKGTNDGKNRDSFYQDQGAGKKEQNQNCLLNMDDGVVNWGEHTIEEEETNHALMAISSNNEVSLCSKTCIDSYNKLKTLCDEQMNQLGEQEAKILAYTLAVKKLEAQIVTFQKQQLSLNEQLTFQGPQKHEICDSHGDNSTEILLSINMTVKASYNDDRRPNINSVRPNINTGRTNVNSIRPKVNTGSSNVNTVRSIQPVPTRISNSFSPKRPYHPLKNYGGMRWGSVTLEVAKDTISGKVDEAKESLELYLPTVQHTVAKLWKLEAFYKFKERRSVVQSSNHKSQKRRASPIGISEDAPDILAFRKELDEIALKHLGAALENKTTNDSDMPELEIFNRPKQGIFDAASYDEEVLVTDFNNLPTEVAGQSILLL